MLFLLTVLAAFIIYIILFMVFRWKTGIAMALAVIGLLASAITYSIGRYDTANQLSIYSYFALAAGVIIALVNNINIKIHIRVLLKIFHHSTKILMGLATVVLLTSAALYSIGRSALSNQISIYAYCILAVGVITLLIYETRSPERK